jgi:nitrogen fixation/metabolism regulation signal transduction histidine kinase
MRRPFSRFELRILFAVLVPSVAPIVASLLFIPQLIQARFAELSHGEVKEQLDRHTVFYGEYFKAKKAEYSATARALSDDRFLVAFADAGDEAGLQERLLQVLADHDEIWGASVVSPSGDLLARAQRPTGLEEFRPKTLVVPLGLGVAAPNLELTFVLSRQYFEDRARAEEVATLYDASLKTFSQRFTEKRQTYYAILGGVALASLLLGFWLSRGVTRRIAALAAGTERVARGDIAFQIPPSNANDEIEGLTRRFNRMLRALTEAQRRIIDLEKISGWQDFARRLAHEIKNPLTPIRLAMQELERRTPSNDPSYRQLLTDVTEVVRDETTRLTRLVNEFSQFARLPDVHPERRDLRTFLEEFSKSYNGFEGRVVLDLPPTPIFAEIDRDQMRQVLHNLVMNGLQAMGESPGEVHIRLREARDAGLARIIVTDAGPGISPAETRKVFEPYYTTKTTGTGLGLAIVKKIVLQHDGQVFVENEPAGGARFEVRLPSVS